MRRKNRRIRGAVAVLTTLAIATAGFLIAGSPASSATEAKGTVSLRVTKLGPVLVNSKGRTLYLFEKDKKGHSSCSGMCAAYWPPLISASKPTAGTGVKIALLGRVKRSDGRWQVTYNKHPLYTFIKDKAAGQVNGENVDGFGAEWYAITAKGVKAEDHGSGGTTSTSTTTSTPTTTDPTTTTAPTKTQPGY